ncbi:endopeptidase, putative [Theileria annulata]|uniref:Endopeptidase, putative n=1 Tax=Theileria annulata TaxID=5874 RepID=Q4UH62_THEAN|nr:endopeptidase, putative [Theileria annulata]CAI73577.1 endopeptidase, putative [Theileria annulata]|eukprot:XP_954254.1 endopeptidase, putative [Theileria annulata]
MLINYRILLSHHVSKNIQKHTFPKYFKNGKFVSYFSKFNYTYNEIFKLTENNTLKFNKSNYVTHCKEDDYGYFGLKVKNPLDLLKLTNDSINYSQSLVNNLVNFPGNKINKEQRDQKDYENENNKVLEVIDDISNVLCSIADPCELLRHVHPDEEWRKMSNTCIELISEFIININVNENIYKLLIENLKENLTNEESFVLKHMIRSMEQQGVHLSKESKMKYKELITKEQMLAFSIVEGNTFKFQLGNLTDNDPLEKIPKDENIYNYLLKNSNQDGLRKSIWFSQRISNQSLYKKMKELHKIRTELSKLRGYDNYLNYIQQECILSNTNDVYEFLINCSKLLKPYLLNDLERLLQYKKLIHENKSEQEEDNLEQKLHPWDVEYLIKMSRNERNVNISLLSLITYFNILLNKLFKITIHPSESKESIYDENVIKYNLIKDGKVISSLYLDLFERLNKHNISAQFTIRCSKKINTKNNNSLYILNLIHENNFVNQGSYIKQLPSSIIVLSLHNDDKKSNVKEILKSTKIDIYNGEIIFHELGHIVHTLLSDTHYQHLSGTIIFYFIYNVLNEIVALLTTRNSRHTYLSYFTQTVDLDDIIYIDKNINEYDKGNLLINKGGLTVFGNEYKLFNSIDMSKVLLLSIIDQWFYGTEEDWYTIEKNINYDIIFKDFDMFNEKFNDYQIYQLLSPNCITNFDHLIHYGGNYYCYLYSKILSLKVFKKFNGLEFEQVGNRLLTFFQNGSIDSSINPINKLANTDLNKISDCCDVLLEVTRYLNFLNLLRFQ